MAMIVQWRSFSPSPFPKTIAPRAWGYTESKKKEGGILRAVLSLEARLELMKATNKDYEGEVIYTCGGRQKGDNKLYTFTSRPVHLLAASYLLLSPVQAIFTRRERDEMRPERELQVYAKAT